MPVIKIALVAVAAAFASLGSAVVTSSDAEARCRGCSAPVVRRTRGYTRRKVRRPVRTVIRRTRSVRVRRVRHVRTNRVVTHIRPIVRVRRIHTIVNRRVVYRSNRTVRRTVRHRARVVHGGTVTRVVNGGTTYVNGCACR